MKSKLLKILLLFSIVSLSCNKKDQVIDERDIAYKTRLSQSYKLVRVEQNTMTVPSDLKFSSFKEAYNFFTKNNINQKQTIKQVLSVKGSADVGSIKSSSIVVVKKNNFGSETKQYSGNLYGYISFPTAPITVIVSCAPTIEYAYYDDGRGAFDSKSYYYFQPSTYNIYDVSLTGGSIEVTGGSISGGSFYNYITQTYTIQVEGNYYNVQRNLYIQGSVSFNIMLPQYEMPNSITMNLSLSSTVL